MNLLLIHLILGCLLFLGVRKHLTATGYNWVLLLAVWLVAYPFILCATVPSVILRYFRQKTDSGS